MSNTDDIVERLRAWKRVEKATPPLDLIHKVAAKDCHEAADLIEQQRDEITRLREGLEIIAGKRQCLDNLMSNGDVARAALEGTTMGENNGPLLRD